MADDIPPGFVREVIEFMTRSRVVMDTQQHSDDELAAGHEALRSRIERIELAQAMANRDQERLTSLETKNPCKDCPTRKAFDEFYANEWPAIRDKVKIWGAIIAALVVLANFLIKVL